MIMPGPIADADCQIAPALTQGRRDPFYISNRNVGLIAAR
jgi:hypothetical protein